MYKTKAINKLTNKSREENFYVYANDRRMFAIGSNKSHVTLDPCNMVDLLQKDVNNLC